MACFISKNEDLGCLETKWLKIDFKRFKNDLILGIVFIVFIC